MHRLAFWHVFLLCVTVPFLSSSAEEPQLLPNDLLADGWIQLFDGETLFGWQPTSGADWQVKDGEIHLSGGEPGFLMTSTEFADYELHVEFKAAADTNSGIFLRTPLSPKDPATDCLELNIAPPTNPFPTGGLVLRKSAENVPAPDADQWHAFDVRLEGAQVTVSLDGKELYTYSDKAMNRRGRIGLQLNKGPVAFRNLRLRPLGLKPIFNGKDLDGWNTDRAEASRFEVAPGELRVLDGRGQIESDDSYGDFVLQLECKVNGDGLNSGVFFRCIPRDFMNGYECQIHNGIVDGDPTKPVDCGTGGIFRRQNARRVVAQDHQWFGITLIANGPHMAAWVDGYQVSDWTDTRAPNENPRRGLRLEPGTIAIQGHDPTTDLLFRNLKIVETTP